MKLYTTPNTPYGRIAKIVVIEKGLEARVEILAAQTRTANCWYYDINPSGRVPCLVLDDGTVLEDSTLVAAWLDEVDGAPEFAAPAGAAGLEQRRFEAMTRSFLDGYSLWLREYLYRDADGRSQTIMDHERARAERLANVFEGAVSGPVFVGPLNMAQITLAAALHGRSARPTGFDWREGRPQLVAWIDAMGERRSVAETAGPLVTS